jgi:hypothetical protein
MRKRFPVVLWSFLALCISSAGLCGSSLTQEEVVGLIRNAALVHSSAIESYSCEILAKHTEREPFRTYAGSIRQRLQSELGISDPERLVEGYSEVRYRIQARPKQVKYRNDQEMLVRAFDSLHYKKEDPQTQFLYPSRCIADGERFYDYTTAPFHGRGATGLVIEPMGQFTPKRFCGAPQPMRLFALDSGDLSEEISNQYGAQEKFGQEAGRVEASFAPNGDLVVQVSGVCSGEAWDLEYVFARSCDCLPVSRHYKSEGTLQHIEVSWKTHVQGGRTFFFPERYMDLRETVEKGVLKKSVKSVMEVSNVKINEPIPEKVFTLEDLGMNIDTVVMDRVAGKNYVLGFSGLVKNLTPSKSMIERAMRDVDVKKLGVDKVAEAPTPRPTPEPKPTPAVKPPQSPAPVSAAKRGWGVGMPLLAAAAGVSLIAIAGVLWRTKGRRRG